MEKILVIGGGPAGAAAAIAAASEGTSVRVVERSLHPRHKVCGEFLSPGVLPILDSLGAREFAGLQPARIRTCRLRFGNREKKWNLTEPAYGLSRFELDRLLLDRALSLGVEVSRGESAAPRLGIGGPSAIVLAVGRQPSSADQNRLFGYKAHFEGPADDAIEMFFGRHGYAGVSPIENGWTNVCGIAPQAVLRRYNFDVDDYLSDFPPLAARLRPLRRRMDWLRVGPLTFSTVSGSPPDNRVYAAGDALGFVDPFTGSGILNALFTGRLAGLNAARAVRVGEHVRECRTLLDRPFGVSALFRKLIEWNCAWHLAALTPGPWLFRLTRAQLQK